MNIITYCSLKLSTSTIFLPCIATDSSRAIVDLYLDLNVLGVVFANTAAVNKCAILDVSLYTDLSQEQQDMQRYYI